MSTTPTPTDNDININTRREADYVRFKHYAALTFLFTSPILIALPPRKLDHLTVLLTGAFAVSANHITHERTGRSILDRLSSRSGTTATAPSTSLANGLPSERAVEIQKRLRDSREKQLREAGLNEEEVALAGRKRAMQERGIGKRVWMGGEEEGWRERREEQERRALAEGRGYGDLIKEYVMDAWKGEKDSSGRGNQEDGGVDGKK